MSQDPLQRKDVIAFLERDWAEARRAKDHDMGNWVRRRGLSSALALEQMLIEQSWARLKTRPSNLNGLLEYRRKMDRANAARR